MFLGFSFFFLFNRPTDPLSRCKQSILNLETPEKRVQAMYQNLFFAFYGDSRTSLVTVMNG